VQHGLTLDHAVINVRSSIVLAAEAYSRLGFHLTERGYHTLGTCNHLAVFQNTYIELLGYEQQATLRTDLVAGPLGLSALAFACEDTTALHRALVAQSFPVDPPQAFSRPVRTSDGEGDARFEIVRLRAGASRLGQFFFCRHLTPELVWRREWQGHANGALNIVRIVASSDDPDQALGVLSPLAGTKNIHPMDGGLAVNVGRTRLECLTVDALRRQFGDAVPACGTDRLVAIVIETRSLASAREALRNGDLDVSGDGRRLIVSPNQACGAVVEFVASTS
jgi:hypothetical protein